MQIAPYGTWASPITAQMAASSSKSIGALQAHGTDIYWLEMRPLEGGRSVVVRMNSSGEVQTMTPEGFNVRTRVHEYGGGSFLVANETVYFSNFADQGLYAQPLSGEPRRISNDDDFRFADCDYDAARDRLVCVREDHTGGGEPVNALATLQLHGNAGNGAVLWSESDFVAYPRTSPSGDQLAWISWDHPNMPWDNVALWVARIDDDGGLTDVRRLNDGIQESVVQPAWGPDGSLYFVADRSGWWNLHRFDGEQITAVHNTPAEFGGPLWGLGADYYAFISADEALVSFKSDQGSQLGILSLRSGKLSPFELPFIGFANPQMVADKAVFLVARGDAPGAIAQTNLTSHDTQILYEAGEQVVDERYLSQAQSIEFPTDGGESAYGYYYAPANADFRATEGELPPLIVIMHGGPTAATSPAFSISVQYWTSRGFALVDVNYRGSTGYGRAYRQKLNGQWGIVDLQDAVAATTYLVQQGLADPHRLLIRGGSAGGYTTLSALAFTDVFAAGANYFGVSDLEALAKDTHKFESRYLDSMVGPYPESADVYRARSPIHALDGFTSPLITFQGLEDRVVPPAQSEMIYTALKSRGTPTAYVTFAGEQHGFRDAKNNVTALQSELYFYGKVLGFEPHGELPAVDIDNLPD